jgi:Tfp pilus assembly protein PilO
MPRSFSVDWKSIGRAPKSTARAVLGVLVAANLGAAWFVFHTPGGSLDQLESDITQARKMLVVRQQALERLRKIADKSDLARKDGDKFLDQYFLARRTAYSTLEVELADAAKAAGIKAKERSFQYQPVEGSDTLGMVTITANFEGTYADLIQFVNQIDRSERLLIIDSLAAQPLQGQSVLAINMKLNAFFREEQPLQAELREEVAH